MSASRDDHLELCPCGGDIIDMSWAPDCRGNDAGRYIGCDNCGRTFTVAELRRLRAAVKAGAA